MKKQKGKVLHMDRSKRKMRPGYSASKPARRLRHQTESLQEHKRAKAINRSTTILAGLFFVVVLVYLVQTVFAFMTTPDIPTDMIRMGSAETPHIIEGIIIRDETVYTAGRDGVVQFYVNNYGRVRPGSLVSSIQNVQSVNDIRYSIAQVEQEIIRLHDIQGNLSAADPAVQRINSLIQNMVDNRLSRHINLNIVEAYALRDDIVQNINMRNQLIVAENMGLRAEPSINHQMLTYELDANRLGINIGAGGIMAPIIDGFEEDLTFTSMYYLSREQTRENVDFNRIIPRREVAYGDSVFKIINSNRWYIAAYIPNELIEGWSVGSTQTIYMEGRPKNLSVRVHHMTPGFEDTFVIFRSGEYMIDFLDTRSVFFRTTDTISHGIRIANSAITERSHLAVPLDAIHERETMRYVVRVIGEDDMEIPIMLVDQDDRFAFVPDNIEFLTLGSILRERENPSATRMISDYRLITGVFRVNVGIADFVPVILPEDDAALGVYSILDPALNTRLQLYDHIVINAALVNDGDIIFSGVR